ncbi:hypothetical protein [Clostridium sp. 1001283B150210_160208_E6]|uniref:hypothetical protein n=1 Tax=Clostridium sp. 1001283B150210_160208_E6 TaxID=2787129 RepID=UPI0018A9BF12|nr:hypothetical protein [Clostridium sp. 1001283B150210_160208_E6]
MKHSAIKEYLVEDKQLNKFLKQKIRVHEIYNKYKDEQIKELLDMFKEDYIEICRQIRSNLKIKNAIACAPSTTTNKVLISIFDYELNDGEIIYANVSQDSDGKLYAEI